VEARRCRWIKKAATIFRTSRGGQPSGGGANYRGKCFAATAAAGAAGAAAGAAAAAAAADAAADAAAADAAAADAAAAAAASNAAIATAAAESWWRQQRTRSWRRWKGWHPAQAGTEPCSWKHQEVNVTAVAMAVAVASVVTVPRRSVLSLKQCVGAKCLQRGKVEVLQRACFEWVYFLQCCRNLRLLG